MERVDQIIIGSGQGGVPLATELAAEHKVVLFERDAVGGSCVNYGCMPSKALLAAAHAAAAARQATELGVRAQVEIDFSAVMQRVRDIIDKSNTGVGDGLEQSGVTVVRAEASFVDQRTVSGNGITVQAPVVVINTGMSPVVPDIAGLEGTPYRTYRDFWEMDELPRRTVVLGGGYVGVELGQALARLGSHVDIVEAGERLVGDEEQEVSDTLAEQLEEDGAALHTAVEAQQVSYEDGIFAVRLGDGTTLQAEALVLAVGQRPNTAALDLEAGGIDSDERGFITVGDRFQTSSEGVYAIGDVTGQPGFTHVSWEDYRRLTAILGNGGAGSGGTDGGSEREMGDRVLGYAFFTEPQVGRVGLTEAAARDSGYETRTVSLPLEQVARSFLTGSGRGFYRMVVDAANDRILGATLVAPEAAELVHVFMALMRARATWQVLERSMHIHPTYAEGLPSLARQLVEG